MQKTNNVDSNVPFSDRHQGKTYCQNNKSQIQNSTLQSVK